MFNPLIFLAFLGREQPPPRGCVLKPPVSKWIPTIPKAAASARLCVETTKSDLIIFCTLAAASARLCVETVDFCLCRVLYRGSRLRAAVC